MANFVNGLQVLCNISVNADFENFRLEGDNFFDHCHTVGHVSRKITYIGISVLLFASF